MGMTSGSSGGSMSEINVTPMIDVLLVLLIIFMVIVPVTPKGLDTLVPQPPKDKQKKVDTVTDRTIVVQVIHRPNAPAAYKINETDVEKVQLLPELQKIYQNRAERVMFVRGDDDLNFAAVADAIDIGRAAGVDHIGLMTPKVMAGE